MSAAGDSSADGRFSHGRGGSEAEQTGFDGESRLYSDRGQPVAEDHANGIPPVAHANDTVAYLENRVGVRGARY